MAASLARSSARVAPRSVTRVAATSVITSATVAALDTTAPVIVMSPTVRYRTVGDMTITGADVSNAATVADVITEVAATRVTERGATRADDRVTEAAMEDRKREGYF